MATSSDFKKLADEISAYSKETAEKLTDLAEAADKADASFLKLNKSQKDAATVLKTYTDAMDQFYQKTRKNTKGIQEVEEASDKAKNAKKKLRKETVDLEDAMRKLNGSAKLIAGNFILGAKEAERMTSKFGLTRGGALGVGAAMIFLSAKMSEASKKFKEAARDISTFNIQAAAIGKTTFAFDTSSFEKLRSELGFTKSQSIELFKIIQKGANTGVASAGQLVEAAKKLQSAFGGDQTKRLGEYIDLLERIPTLETDFSVSANLDDKAASLFALAKEGKVSTLIEMQSAGLLGGLNVNTTNKSDVKLLNNQQQALKLQEDIKDFFVGKLYPSWSPQLTVIADSVSGMFKILGTLVTVLGAMSFFSTKSLVGLKGIERAIKTTIGLAGGSAIGAGDKKAEKLSELKDKFKDKLKEKAQEKFAEKKDAVIEGLKKAFKDKKNIGSAFKNAGATGGTAAIIKQFNPALSKSFSKIGIKAFPSLARFSGVLGPATTGLKIFAKAATSAAAIWSVILGVVSWGAKKLSEKLEATGNMTAAAGWGLAAEVTNAGATIAGFAAAGMLLGATITAIGGPFAIFGATVGAIAGTLVGVGVAMYSSASNIGKATTKFGKSLQSDKFQGWVQSLGKKFEVAGMFMNEFGKAIKETITRPFVDFGRGVVASLGFLKEFAVSTLDNITVTEAEAKSRKNARRITRELSKEFAILVKNSGTYSEALAQEQKDAQPGMLAFQAGLLAMDKVVKSAKMQLFNLAQETAKLDMSNIREFGGSTTAYKMAINEATRATKRKFEELTDGLTESRVRILKNGQLSGEQREAQLVQLHKYELEATKDYVSAMDEVIRNIMKAPDILLNELEGKIKGQRFEFGLEAGFFSTEELFAQIDDRLATSIQGLDKTINAFDQAAQLQDETNAVLRENKTKAKEALQSVFAGMSEEIKKDLGIKVGIEGLDLKGAENLLLSVNMKMIEFQDAVDDVSKKLPEGDLKSFTENANALRVESQRIAEEIEKADNALKEALKDKDTEAQEKAMKAKEASTKNQTEVAARTAENEAKAAKWFRIIGIKEKDISIATGLITSEVQVLADDFKKQPEAYERILTALKASGQADEEALKLLEKRKESLDEYAKASILKGLLQGVVSAEKAEIKEKERQLELEKQMMDKAKEVQSIIGDVNKILDDTMKGWSGRQILASLDFGAAKMEFAGFSDDITASTEAAFQITKKALDEELALKMATTDKWIANAKEAARAEARVLAKTKLGSGASQSQMREEEDRLMLEKERTIDAEAQAKQERLKGEYVQKQLNIVKDMTAKRMEEVDIQKEIVEAGMEIAELFNGTAASMVGFLREGLELEKETLAKLQEQAVEARKIAGNSVETRKLDLEVIKQTAKVRKKELENVNKIAELRSREVTTAMEGLDSELDYLSFIGANWRRMLNIQGQQVSMARQLYEIEKDKLEDWISKGVVGQQLTEQENKVRKAWFEMQKKGVGLQKDIMEKILGAAFGSIRGSVGARRGLDRISSTLGIKKTRAYTRGGMPMEAPGGGGTKSSRAGSRMAQGRRGGYGNIEDQIRDSLKETNRHGSNTSTNTGNTVASVKGFAATSAEFDTTSCDLLKKILEELQKRTNTGVSASGTGKVIGVAASAVGTESGARNEKQANAGTKPLSLDEEDRREIQAYIKRQNRREEIREQWERERPVETSRKSQKSDISDLSSEGVRAYFQAKNGKSPTMERADYVREYQEKIKGEKDSLKRLQMTEKFAKGMKEFEKKINGEVAPVTKSNYPVVSTRKGGGISREVAKQEEDREERLWKMAHPDPYVNPKTELDKAREKAEHSKQGFLSYSRPGYSGPDKESFRKEYEENWKNIQSRIKEQESWEKNPIAYTGYGAGSGTGRTYSGGKLYGQDYKRIEDKKVMSEAEKAERLRMVNFGAAKRRQGKNTVGRPRGTNNLSDRALAFREKYKPGSQFGMSIGSPTRLEGKFKSGRLEGKGSSGRLEGKGMPSRLYSSSRGPQKPWNPNMGTITAPGARVGMDGGAMPNTGVGSLARQHAEAFGKAPPQTQNVSNAPVAQPITPASSSGVDSPIKPSPATPSSSGGDTSGSTTFSIKGDLTVRFEGAPFNDAMGTLVAKLISSDPQVKLALAQMGLKTQT